MFLFSTISRPAPKHTKQTIQYELGIHIPVVRQLVHDTDQHHLAPKLTLSVRTEYIYSVASQATSPVPFKYLFNKYPYWIF
jgi:hypothetical protein